MTLQDAIRIVKEQTIPGPRASGGSGHADAARRVVVAAELLVRWSDAEEEQRR